MIGMQYYSYDDVLIGRDDTIRVAPMRAPRPSKPAIVDVMMTATLPARL